MTRVKLSVTLPENLVERVKTYTVPGWPADTRVRLSPSQVVEAALTAFFYAHQDKRRRP